MRAEGGKSHEQSTCGPLRSGCASDPSCAGNLINSENFSSETFLTQHQSSSLYAASTIWPTWNLAMASTTASRCPLRLAPPDQGCSTCARKGEGLGTKHKSGRCGRRHHISAPHIWPRIGLRDRRHPIPRSNGSLGDCRTCRHTTRRALALQSLPWEPGSVVARQCIINIHPHPHHCPHFYPGPVLLAAPLRRCGHTRPQRP